MRKSVLLLVCILFTACSSDSKKESILPITERSFRIGIVATPKNFPNFSSEDHVESFQMVDEFAELIPIWKGEGNFSNVMKGLTVLRSGLVPIFGVGFTIGENLSDPVVREKKVSELSEIARAYKPEYFNIMNEVNLYFYANNNSDLDNISGLYKEIYDAVKEVSPETKVFPTFAYHIALRENSSLLDLISLFEPKIDIYAFTSYPERNYGSVQEIPDSYYDELRTLPGRVGFTEIGWPGNNESEQADFLIWFLNNTKDMNLEFVCWLWLHDYPADYTMPYLTTYFNNHGLRRNDGSPKLVWEYWTALSKIKK